MSTRRALFFSFVDRYSGLLINIGSSMVIARLLRPDEIGVFSVAMVLLAFIQTLRDFGAGQYLLQERDLTQERIRATWAVQLGAGLCFGLIALAAAVPAGHFYDDDRVRDIFFVVAVNFVITPFGSLTYSWLMREVRFESLAVMRCASSLIGAVVSIYLAWTDHGAISLAYGSLAGTVTTAAVGIFFRPAHFPWRPGLSEVKRVWSFGSRATGTNMLNTLGNGTPELVLGKFHSMTDVGMFSRANGLVSMFNRLFLDATYPVAMARFAELHRAGESLIQTLSRFTAAITLVGWAFFAFVASNADFIIRFLYGDQWTPAALPVQILCGAGALLLPHSLFGAALLASGNAEAVLRAATLDTVQRVALFSAGASIGVEALAALSVLAAAIGFLIWSIPVCKLLRVRRLDLFPNVHRAVLPALAVGSAALLPHLLTAPGQFSETILFIGSTTLAAIAFMACGWVVRADLVVDSMQKACLLCGRVFKGS